MENNKIRSSKNPPLQRGIFSFKAFLILCLTFFCTFIFSQAQLKVTDAKKSFGFVKKGEVVTIKYPFTNEGNQPLVITEAKFECSCTSVEFPKQPIAPGKNDTIYVKFDTKSVYDRQDRTVDILSNAKPVTIRFKGVVLKK